MLGKLIEAVQLLAGHFLLLGSVILTVSIPINLATNYVLYYVIDANDFGGAFRSQMWIEGIFRPIAIAAVIYALSEIKNNRSVNYGQAMSAGFRFWVPLFAVRLVAGLGIGFGLILLIIPGIILSLMWALVAPVVVLEGGGVGTAFRRSSDLTDGVRLQIMGLAIITFFCVMFLAMAFYVPIELSREFLDLSLPSMVVIESLVDSVIDIFYSVMTIVLFLYYWDRCAPEQKTDSEYAPVPLSDPFGDNVSLPPLQKPTEDGNPYRPPKI